MHVDLPQTAWSTQNLHAQGQREALVKFWLAAPTDLLETLWATPVGNATTELVRQLKDDSQLLPAQIDFRNRINEKLSQGLQQPLAPQMLLANFLYSPIGRLQIANPDQQLPAWFVAIYRNLYEGGPSSSIASEPVTSTQQSPKNITSENDLNVFPSTLQELVSNRIQLNRMLGLSNLHYIDPEDQEILEELLDLRRSFANAIQNCSEDLLQGLWVNDLSDRYWAMVRSGIQKQKMSMLDEQIKQAAVTKLSPAQGGGFDQPGSIGALLIAMLYFEPGTMQVNDPEKNIPAWLLENFQQIFMQALSAN